MKNTKHLSASINATCCPHSSGKAVGLCLCSTFADDCWSIFLHIADIMVPVQEKVWSPVRKVACLLFFLCLFLFPFLCSVCLTVLCMMIDSIFSALLFWCCVLCEYCSALWISRKSLYQRFDLCSIWSAILAAECEALLLLSRHQPGSAPLPGQQSHRGRLWSRVCPQRQPRLLTSALWLCQRTGTRVHLSVCSPSYFLCFVIIRQLVISLQQKVVKDKSKQWLCNKWKHLKKKQW